MKVTNAKSEAVETATLVPHPQNPRQGDVGAIVESIKENGWYGTIVAQQGTNFILAGNHRWQAAKLLGMERVPVTYIDVDDETALRILLADNRTSDLASHDDNILTDLLKELSLNTEKGLAGTGWDDESLDNLLAMLGPDLFVPMEKDPIEELQDFLGNTVIRIECPVALAEQFRLVSGETDEDRLRTLLNGR